MSAPAAKLWAWLRNEWLLIFVAALYLVAAVTNPSKAEHALVAGGRQLLAVSVIILSVFGLIGLLGVWVDKKKITRHLGEGAGFRSVVFAVLFGTVLVGPVYVVFPLLKSIREHGARWAVVTAVLTAWALKIPMIPLEVEFLGIRFAVVRAFLTFVGALALGLGVERVMGGRNSAAVAAEGASPETADPGVPPAGGPRGVV